MDQPPNQVADSRRGTDRTTDLPQMRDTSDPGAGSRRQGIALVQLREMRTGRSAQIRHCMRLDHERVAAADIGLPDQLSLEPAKSPRPIFRRGLQNFCDGEVMPVICPTCQILLEWPPIFPASAFLVKSLNRRRGSCAGKGFRSSDRWRRAWRRTCLGGHLILGCEAGW
jgi:hypothetical protein